MTYLLGVDLGTTFTAAAVERDGSVEMLGLGNRALQIPSVLYRDDDGTFLVGEAAERRGVSDPLHVTREFKRRLGDHVPILVAGSPYSAESLMARLLAWVVDRATERMGSAPDEVVLSHPANWRTYRLDLLHQVGELAGLADVSLCAEPAAAAAQYSARSSLQVGERVAVYDLGGGTFDVCVMEKTIDGFRVLGTPAGVEHLGGVDLDRALFHHVVDGLQGSWLASDDEDPETLAALARLQRECVEAKEALSTDTHATLTIALPGLATSRRVTRSEFEGLIRPAIEETVAATNRAIASAGLQPDGLTTIVSVGGSSRIPLIVEMLQTTFGVPVALDTHPKHDIALGTLRLTSGGGALPLSQGRPGHGQPGPGQPGRQGQLGASAGRATEHQPSTLDSGPDPLIGTTADGSGPPTRADTAATASAGTAAGTGVEERTLTGREASAEPAGPDDRSSHPRTIVLVAALAAIGAVVGLLIIPAVRDTGRGPAGQPTASGSASIPSAPADLQALPRSSPLTGSELLVPMKVASGWRLYRGDTKNQAPVDGHPGYAGSSTDPVVSPDLRSVIYVHDPDVYGERQTLRVAGARDWRGDRQLFDGVPAGCEGRIGRPAWNRADPTMLALACSDERGNTHLILIRTNGELIREIETGQQRLGDPTFSPDGASVAFWGGPVDELEGGSILVSSTITDAPPRQLTTATSRAQDANPAWSPDGTMLAFRRRVPDGTAEGQLHIFVMRADGTAEPERLTFTGRDNSDPTWAPSSQALAYLSSVPRPDESGSQPPRVWLMNKNGSDKNILWTEQAEGAQGRPSWSAR